jgi:serine protease Do
VGQTAPDTRARLTVLRSGQTHVVTVVIAELPDDNAEPRAEPPPIAVQPGVLGMQLRDLTVAQQKQLGVSQGVLVDQLSAEGPAYRAGVRPGDVILQIQGRAVRSSSELGELVQKLPHNKPVPVLVRRGAAALFLALRIGG